jgi:ribosomal protein L40E
MSAFWMRNSRLLKSLFVSAVMLASVLTGVYSTMVEPTQRNIITATRTTEGSTYSEKTHVYTAMSIGVTTVRTVTSTLNSCSYGCSSDDQFFSSIDVLITDSDGRVRHETWHNVCVHFKGGSSTDILGHYSPIPHCTTVPSYTFSLSSRILTLTSTSVTRSPVYFHVTVTESHSEIVPNPLKLDLQILTVVLLIIGVAGVVLAIIRTMSTSAQPSLKPAAASEPDIEKSTPMPKLCRNCGARVHSYSIFCQKCGSRLV